jgi:uncharacterized delta-60 repeat protein
MDPTDSRRQPGTRRLLALLRLVPAVGLLAVQLAVAGPAQARAGDLDPGFGTGGKVVTDFAGLGETAHAVAVQANGKIVAAGRTDTSDTNALGDWALARYRTNGALDPGFGSGGKVDLGDFTGNDADDLVNALAIQPSNGRIVAAGVAANNWALARFRHDGTLDASFGTGGKVTGPFGGQARALAVQADGKLVAAGNVSSDFAVARYNPNGTLDASFGTDGVVTTGFGDFFAQANAVAVQSDGKIVAAGHTGSAAFAIARYNRDGNLDATFGSGGIVTTAFGGFFEQANALVIQSNGKLVAAGENFGAAATFALARYNPNGTLDATFGSGGKVTTDFGSQFSTAAALVVQADGRLVAAGDADAGPDGTAVFALARYRTNGTLDPGFGSGGKVTTDFGEGNDVLRGLARQADGKLVAAGGFDDNGFGGTDFALARYLGS